jgi:hypothetical protein
MVVVLEGQISKSDTTYGFGGNIPLDPNPCSALSTFTIVFVKKYLNLNLVILPLTLKR